MKRIVGNSVSLLAFAILAIATTSPIGAQGLGAVTRPQVTRPDGPVWQVIRTKCTKCHGIDDYAYYNLDKAGWTNLVQTKHKSLNVTLTAADESTLTEWLATEFGPNTKPFPRAYKATEITTYLTDPEADGLIEKSCTRCHARERVDQARKTELGWRVTMLDMRERGARITDDELEHLVEWAGRVLGTNRDK